MQTSVWGTKTSVILMFGCNSLATSLDLWKLYKDESMAQKLFGFQQLTATVKNLALILFFYIFSISLTFYNKWLLTRFHFPLSVSVIHYTLVFVLSVVIRWCWEFKVGKKRKMLEWSVYFKRVLPTAAASALDIGLSNWSLMFITVSLYTMTKSTSIIFILICALIFRLEKWHFSLLLVVLLISGGLFMFTYKSTQFNATGFVIVLTASGISGIRWTLAQVLTQKESLGLHNPVDTLYHIQPFMTLVLTPLAFIIEGPRMAASPQLFSASSAHVAAVSAAMVLFGCFLAFMLSVSEYLLLSHTSSLTMSISGIFKEICTLSLATEIGGDQMTLLNFFGLLLCLCGIAVHVVHKATKDQDNNEFKFHKLRESGLNPSGDAQSVEMLPLNYAEGDEEGEEREYELGATMARSR